MRLVLSLLPCHAPRPSTPPPLLLCRRSDRGCSLDQEPYLDRIERLAYVDKRRLEASRSALADQVHASECTFRPAINTRSARMVRVSRSTSGALKHGGKGTREGLCACCFGRSQGGLSLHNPSACS